MGHTVIQNDFTHGELDPRLYSRVDLQVYYKTARRLRNCFILPQGAATKRPGSLFIEELNVNEDEYKLAEFRVEPNIFYLIVFIHTKIRIYRKVANRQFDFLIQLESPYEATQIKDIRFSQNNQGMIIVHELHKPYLLRNLGDDITWSIAEFIFSKLPAVDFGDINYDTFTFTLDNVQPGERTLTSSNNIFSIQYIGGNFVSIGNVTTSVGAPGVAEIIQYLSPTSVKVRVLFEFDAVLASGGIIGTKVSVSEPAFSEVRGYPKSVTFYENRLWLGGGSNLPQSLFASRIGNVDDFDTGRGFEDDAIIEAINSKQAGSILHLEGFKSLQIFTTRGEFTIPQLEESALTPSNISVRLQSVNGTNDVDPIIADNQTFFIQKGGKNIMKFIYSNTSASYQAVHANNLSAHLINNPVDSTALLSPSNFDAEFVFFINSDGTLLTLQTMEEQNIEAWSMSATGQDITLDKLNEETITPNYGKYKRIQTVGDDIFFIVQRFVNGEYKQYLEVFDFDIYTDSSSFQDLGSPQTIMSGLEHLEGIEVWLKGDGFALLPQIVTNGEVTLSRPSQNVEAGIIYNPLVCPSAINLQTDNGPSLYRRINIFNVWLDFYKSAPFSLSLNLNDNELVFDRQLGPNFLNHPPILRTDVIEKQVQNNEAWKIRPNFYITQDNIFPLTILSVGMEFK